MNRSERLGVWGRSLPFKSFNLRYLVILLALMAGLPFLAHAQDATIVGTVTDPSGALMPHVDITLTQVETGRVRVVTTNDSGEYAAPTLQTGHYNVKAEAGGFKVEERQGITLNVNDRTRVDFQMTVGATAESVSVESAPIAVQADSGAVSSLITGQQMTQLATNGRSIYTLMNLTTGSVSLQGDFQTPTPVGGNATVSFNGNRPGHNIYLLDGGENLDRGGSGTFSVMPSLDALAEAQTLTSNYSAQYGLSSGATVTTVVKAGSKDFHASLWEFLRNNDLDARNFFNPAPQTVAKLNYNTYGFNAGGPVTFGKLYNPDRSKTFFFYNMEWRSLIQGGLVNQVVPPTTEYGGDFSGNATTITVPSATEVTPGVLAANCPGGVLPAGIVQGSPFPGNVIPACMLNPNAQSLLTAGGKYGGIFPANNFTSGGQPSFQGGNNTPTNVREEIVRIDENATKNFTIFGHFIAEQINQGYGTSQWVGDNVPSASDNFGNPSYSGVVHTAYVISPTLVNEASFNYNGNRINIIPTGLSTAPSDFVFNRYFTGPNTLDRIPNINLTGTTGTSFQIGWEPWVNKADDYQLRDDVSWTHGNHQVKMGGSWALYKKIQDLFTQTQGNFNFNGSYTGNDFADYLLGLSNTYSEAGVQDAGHWNNVSWAAYIEDNWRVNQRLTLNLGLRWDGVPHTYEANNRMSNFYPNLYNPADAAVFINPNTISPASPGLGTSPNAILTGSYYLNGIGISGQNGIPQSLVNNHWAAFGPRLGFAYDLTGSGKTVIRGGFGIMYERIQGNDMYNAGPNPPFSASVNFTGVSLSNPTALLAGGPISVGIPVSQVEGLEATNYDLPRSTQYSLGIQHSIGTAVISASYVGSQNRHQNDYRQIDLPALSALPGLVAAPAAYNEAVNYLGYNSVLMSEDEANGSYNSFQTSMRGNLKGNQLTYQFGYTYSHTTDPTNGTGSGSDLNNISNPYLGWKYDMGPSIFDRRNVFFANYVWQIPFLKNNENKFVRTLIGGWELSGIVTAESGAPLNITESGGTAGNPCSGSTVQDCTDRPDLVGSINYPHTVSEWFNPNVFAASAPGTWGNLAHNVIRGPGRDNWNMSLFKNFVFSESRGSALQFRAEYFNIWNHTQFQGDAGNGGISTTYGSGNFGAITSAYDPRTLQLGLKLIF